MSKWGFGLSEDVSGVDEGRFFLRVGLIQFSPAFSSSSAPPDG
ncbi:MAG: hypothetical protein QY306_07630 [Anaerolineales bacterium]|nr:MAG: hypothetical protein QY306_07630 [Anaerolineales bacterium]